MKVFIDKHGVMRVGAENQIELFALRSWYKGGENLNIGVELKRVVKGDIETHFSSVIECEDVVEDE